MMERPYAPYSAGTLSTFMASPEDVQRRALTVDIVHVWRDAAVHEPVTALAAWGKRSSPGAVRRRLIGSDEITAVWRRVQAPEAVELLAAVGPGARALRRVLPKAAVLAAWREATALGYAGRLLFLWGNSGEDGQLLRRCVLDDDLCETWRALKSTRLADALRLWGTSDRMSACLRRRIPAHEAAEVWRRVAGSEPVLALHAYLSHRHHPLTRYLTAAEVANAWRAVADRCTGSATVLFPYLPRPVVAQLVPSDLRPLLMSDHRPAREMAIQMLGELRRRGSAFRGGCRRTPHLPALGTASFTHQLTGGGCASSTPCRPLTRSVHGQADEGADHGWCRHGEAGGIDPPDREAAGGHRRRAAVPAQAAGGGPEVRWPILPVDLPGRVRGCGHGRPAVVSSVPSR
jgi:hypothetical protein